ncbi:uncharacterized protein B0T15DRAFT_525945 [Chaetomium strumarium]|uniref:Uncharacterized protein n=1 Tax=Chaetomium strumarium TaxID=1170767 RepID=A0AAJ0M4R1_9PEZI|nr:hypothetical protein B0T15DRAFT_525945 [Chaetomium strumarium]
MELITPLSVPFFFPTLCHCGNHCPLTAVGLPYTIKRTLVSVRRQPRDYCPLLNANPFVVSQNIGPAQGGPLILPLVLNSPQPAETPVITNDRRSVALAQQENRINLGSFTRFKACCLWHFFSPYLSIARRGFGQVTTKRHAGMPGRSILSGSAETIGAKVWSGTIPSAIHFHGRPGPSSRS